MQHARIGRFHSYADVLEGESLAQTHRHRDVIAAVPHNVLDNLERTLAERGVKVHGGGAESKRARPRREPCESPRRRGGIGTSAPTPARLYAYEAQEGSDQMHFHARRYLYLHRHRGAVFSLRARVVERGGIRLERSIAERVDCGAWRNPISIVAIEIEVPTRVRGHRTLWRLHLCQVRQAKRTLTCTSSNKLLYIAGRMHIGRRIQ